MRYSVSQLGSMGKIAVYCGEKCSEVKFSWVQCGQKCGSFFSVRYNLVRSTMHYDEKCGLG